MRILWVKVGGLWPLNTGGRIRTFHILRELSQRHAVVLVTTHGPDDDPEGLAAALPDARVVSLPHRPAKQGSLAFAAALLRSWASPLPVDLVKWRLAEVRRTVQAELAGGSADVCVADFLSAIPNVPLRGKVPVVLFEHNVEHMIWKRLSGLERRWWRRLPLELEWRKVRRAESRACTRADLTLAVSEPDRAMLAALAPGARVEAISTGVDTSYFAPHGFREAPGTLVFTGSMDWYPNQDAILHFADTILPLVRREVPGATLTVVGRDPGPRLLAAASGALRITGRVEDVRPYVGEAAVYVVPLRAGGGTRLKIFEALAMSKAVVSTTVGAEGLPLTPGRHFVQADDPAAFAAAVVALLQDPVRRRALGAAGRRLVDEHYSWRQVAREFEGSFTRFREAVPR